MPILKPISGHGATGGIRRYLEKGGRALARDLFNLSYDERDAGALGDEAKEACAWDAEMDATRAAFGTDAPWRGKPARTFKHFVLSPDPGDDIDLAALRELACSWALKHFGDHEIAIVYHDDNARGIPHAHIVVNNANLRTGYRMQTQHPEDLNRDLQDMARERGLSGLSNDRAPDVSATAKSAERATLSRRRRPRFPAGGATALWPPALPRAAAQGALDRGVVEVRGPDLNLQRRGALGVPGRDRPARDLPSAELREPDRHRDVLCAERGQPPRGVRGPHDCPLSGSPSPSAASASRSFMR